MKLFQKNYVPKKLSIKDMWQLYKNLRQGVSTDSHEYLLDELIALMGRIDTESFLVSLHLLYGKHALAENPVDAALMFTRGLKENEFFQFCDFVKEIVGGNSKRK